MCPRPKTRPHSRPTITDVATRAGVSIATVSRVINQNAPVAAETMIQVQTAIAELNYQPRTAARVLASQRTHAIGMLFPDISGDFFSPLLRGIEAEAREAGFALLIYATQGEPVTQGNKHYPVGENNSDGLVIFVDSVPDAELARLNRIGFPIVLIHRSTPKGLNIPCITIENKRGARLLVDHLIERHGHRRIAFLAGLKGHEDAQWREAGYREALEAHGIPFAPQLVSPGDFNKERAQAATEEWIAKGVEFDAIFAADDDSALGALTALKNHGRRVPEDVAVVGFDDTPLSRYLTPPLTTVRAPIEQIGHEAIRQLVRLIEGEQADPLVLLPTELIVRRSCGCPDHGNEPPDEPC